MADFPLAGMKEDTSKFSMDVEDTGMRAPMEGGYVISRARTTRRPRRTWTTGLTDISNAQYTAVLTFYNTYGTYKAFTYYVTPSNETVNVRFVSPPSFDYRGYGNNYRWDVTGIKLEEV